MSRELRAESADIGLLISGQLPVRWSLVIIWDTIDSMTEGSRSSPRTQVSDVPTVGKIIELLRAAVPGAEELDDKLKRVFRLSEAQASLRLK